MSIRKKSLFLYLLLSGFLSFLMMGPKTVWASCPDPDGIGTATFEPAPSSIYKTGNLIRTTMTFTVPVEGIQTGGKIAMRVPDNWYSPAYDPGMMSGNYGAVDFSTSVSVTAGLTLNTSGQLVIVNVNSGSLASGDIVTIHYDAFTCDSNSSGNVRVFSQGGSCGQLSEIAASPFNRVMTQGGDASFVGFDNYELAAVVNATTSLTLSVYDNCHFPVPTPGDILGKLNSVKDHPFGDENNIARISLTSGFTSPATYQNLLFSTGTTSMTVYYMITSTVNNPDNYLRFDYGDSMFSNSSYSRLTALINGISNPSVDTGALVAGQKSVSFSPDGDRVGDELFINFTLPDTFPWEIHISSDGFNTIVRKIYGHNNAGPVRTQWDGYMDVFSSFGPPSAPPGLYQIKITAAGGSLVNTVLNATVTANGITGYVKDGVTTGPLSGARVQFHGQSYRAGITEANGRFLIYGLSSGLYNYDVEKAGYLAEHNQLNVTSGLVDIGTVTLSRASILRLNISRPSASQLPEIWGGRVEAHTQDWSLRSNAQIHFAQDSLIADNGDFFSVNPATYTELSLAPDTLYYLEYSIPNFGAPTSTVTVGANLIVDMPVVLTPRANIEGGVEVPANPNGLFVSVEAGIDADGDGRFDSFGPSSNFYGGAWLPPSQTTGTYILFGVENGTYTLRARAEGYASVSTRTVVSNNANVFGVDFPIFNEGGIINGMLNFVGSTEALDDDNNGFFDMWVNCFSPFTYEGSFAQLNIATSATSHSYQLKGLSNGYYEIYLYLPGFEVNPPGRIVVNVVGGVGSSTITLRSYDGSLSGNVSLPGGATDYNNVSVELNSFSYGNYGSFTTVPSTAGVYTFSNLGTGFYTLRAVYSTTGLVVEKGVQITNGQDVVRDLNMTGSTYRISGRVTSSARSPYDSLSYLVNQTTPTTLYPLKGSPVSVNANRIVAERLNDRDHNDISMGGSSATDPSLIYDPLKTFFGEYNAQTGTYSIVNVTPGTYRIYNNGELDNDTDNGPEIASVSQVVSLINQDLTGVNFTLSDGFNITGNLVVDSGVSESGHLLEVVLRNNSGDEVSTTQVYLIGTSAGYTLERVPPGSYILTAADRDYPRKYSAKEISVQVVSANLANKDVKLLDAARIKGKLRVKKSGILLTQQNYSQYIHSSFHIEARSNPWFPGGWGRVEDFQFIDSDGYFNMVVSPGTYDVIMKNDGFIGNDAIARGKKQFVPIQIGGVVVAAGETEDLGVIDLVEGAKISGTVRDSASVVRPNIVIEANPSGKDEEAYEINAITDEAGRYTLVGLDPDNYQYYDITAAPRPDPHDERYAGFEGSIYAENRKNRVDIRQVIKTTGTVDFQVELALGSVSGYVQTPDGGSLLAPFGENESLPGAIILMNKRGNIPQDNPLGDIEDQVYPDGTFQVRGLGAGSYDMWVLAKNYGSATRRNITVTNSDVYIGTLTMSAGYKMFGTLTYSDGSLPNSSNIEDVVAVRDGFSEILIGNMDKDASGNITKYSISGFRDGLSYSLLLFTRRSDDLIVLSNNVSLTGDTERNFTIQESTPLILSQSTYDSSTGSFTIHLEFTRPLRNSGNTDNDPSILFRLKTGSGTISYPTDWISSDRQRAVINYAPAAGEQFFVITASVTFVTLSATTGNNHTRVEDFTYYAGIRRQKAVRVANANGGALEFEEDPSGFSAQAGTFGEDAELVVDVGMRVALDVDDVAGQLGVSGLKAMGIAQKLGAKAYPSEMGKAMSRARTSAVSPFSSFYDIFLPAGVSHSFPEGKEAQLCLRYDASDPDADPYSMNIYYYNAATDEYLLENGNRSVDTDNERICVSISHASVFTVLQSSVPIIAGSGYNGDLKVTNFPNPFNLKSKAITLQDPGAFAANQTVEGTMIKISVPNSIAGTVEIQIFSVTGEKVRTINRNVTSGAHNYIEWDGRNDGGEKVASGTYIGRLTIGDGNERFFKMAVLK